MAMLISIMFDNVTSTLPVLVLNYSPCFYFVLASIGPSERVRSFA
jgi:hypothetical protein